MNLNALKVYPAVEFPVPRGTPNVSSCISKIWDHSADWEAPTEESFVPKSGGASSEAQFEIDISEESADNYIVSR